MKTWERWNEFKHKEIYKSFQGRVNTVLWDSFVVIQIKQKIENKIKRHEMYNEDLSPPTWISLFFLELSPYKFGAQSKAQLFQTKKKSGIFFAFFDNFFSRENMTRTRIDYSVCNGYRLMKHHDSFLSHFWPLLKRVSFFRQLEQYQKLAWALNQISITKLNQF